jgi:hypothetical protein
MKLSREEAQSIVWQDHETAEIVLDKVTSNTRWSIVHRLVFKLNDKYYETRYSKGATEYQDEQPFQYDTEVECKEVEPYEKTSIDYREIA